MSLVGNRGPDDRHTPVAGHSTLRAVPPLPGGNDYSHELLGLAARGDEAAVRALYRQHVGRVHRHVARILGRHDPDVEDVVQKVFLAALAGARQFDGRSAVSTWILGIATRRALDEARARWRRGRFARVADRVGLGRPALRPDARHGVLAQAEAALALLSPDQRTVFVLHEVEGHTLEEIRQMTGTSLSTLHARLQRARRLLRDHMDAEGEPS
jgi:RNA polymerase sigma-70 factor, ECF subfamily